MPIKKSECPHVQWWESDMGQQKVRRCVSCGRLQVQGDHGWENIKRRIKADLPPKK
jgi:hypothetical protein